MPDGWAWCRLPEICVIPITDGTHQTPTYCDKENGVPFLSSKDVTSGKIDWSKIKYITKELHQELQKRIAPKKDDILLAKNGTTGVAAIVEDETIFDIYVTLAVIRPNQKIVYPEFLLNIINSPFCKNQFNEHLTGIGVPNLHLVDINKTFIPLPPLNEQRQITDKIGSYTVHIDELEKNKSDLQTAIKQAKSKILDLAIHGKLVPQDPNDEPAEVLLKRIATSDNRPYKKFEEEEPFEIPSNWSWCFLGDICSKIKRGKSPKYVDKSTIMAFAQKCNQKDGPTSLDKALYIDETTLKKYPEEEKMQFNDIVINSTGTGTLGRVGIFNCSIPNDVNAVYPDSHVTTVRILPEIDKLYCYYFIKTKQSYLETMGEGSTNQKELKPDTISSLYFPLPPYPEQKRIVSKIEELFKNLDEILQNLLA